MNEQAIAYFSGEDRRSATGFNRFRRFLNNYWLVPIIICYIQLVNQVVYPANTPLERFSEGNRAFFRGIPVAYELATHKFPFTILGHFYEIGLNGLYKADLLQVSHEDLKVALSAPRLKQDMYNRLLQSREYHKSEIGGLISMSYNRGKPSLHFHEIPSLNGLYLKQLRSKIDAPSAFIGLVAANKNEEIIDGVGIRKEWTENTLTLLQSDRISESTRRTLRENFLEMYEALSESRYLLSPLQFKEGLGKIPYNERFIGIFHFHNGLNEPPSATDIQQSMRNRQIVITFSEPGWTVYDVAKQDLEKIDISIDKQLSLQ